MSYLIRFPHEVRETGMSYKIFEDGMAAVGESTSTSTGTGTGSKLGFLQSGYRQY